MAKARTAQKTTEKNLRSNASTSKAPVLDVVFTGPLLFVPHVQDGSIRDVEVFSPDNGHHIGAVFLPGVIFSDAELDDPLGERWPAPESFSLLDPHSYTLELKQTSKGKKSTLAVADIPETNHKVQPGRRLSHAWTVAIQVNGRLSAWTSHRLGRVRDGLLVGADAPAKEFVSSLHRLRYEGITNADFHGAASEPRAYLRAHGSEGGTLIIIGEIPYQSTLLHERKAIDAMARLAGLDLHLAETGPAPFQARLMQHLKLCGLSVIVA